jgi:hypothetical protein
MRTLPVLVQRPVARPVCRRPGCPAHAFYCTGYCFEDGLTYIAWRVARDRLEAADLAAGGHLPQAEPDDDPDLSEALDLIYLYRFRGPFE